jgi:hypothetical protein
MTTKIDTILLDSSAALSAPDVSRLTTRSLEGTGVFDILMASTKLHLKQEYEENRITGEEYATVYLGALQSVMQQAVQFLLNTQQEEKIQSEIALVRQKTVTELAQTDDDLPVGLGFNGDTQVEGLVASKKAIDALQANLVQSQVDKENIEGDLLGQRIITELSQTSDNLSQATSAGYGFNNSSSVESLTRAQVDKLLEEISLITNQSTLVEQQTATEVAQTSNTKPIDLGLVDSTSIAGLAESQRKKTENEVILLAQKAVSELAQTSDYVPIDTDALNTDTAVTGIVDKQKNLFTAQTDGFARDAEQKAAKMLLDTWSVSATQGVATASSANGLDEASLGAVVTKLKSGIGV